MSTTAEETATDRAAAATELRRQALEIELNTPVAELVYAKQGWPTKQWQKTLLWLLLFWTAFGGGFFAGHSTKEEHLNVRKEAHHMAVVMVREQETR